MNIYCKHCKTTKNAINFPKDQRYKKGYRKTCKACEASRVIDGKPKKRKKLSFIQRVMMFLERVA